MMHLPTVCDMVPRQECITCASDVVSNGWQRGVFWVRRWLDDNSVMAKLMYDRTHG